jgi:hypothetical protein
MFLEHPQEALSHVFIRFGYSTDEIYNLFKIYAKKIKYVDKIEYVEVNKLKDWQIILMVLGGLLLGIIGFKLVRIIRK